MTLQPQTDSALVSNFQAALEHQLLRIEHLEMALEFYANENNYQGLAPEVQYDSGDCARWALGRESCRE